MKTKFILHGGFNPGQTSEDNSEFYKEILKDAPENVQVLLVPFAKDEERIIPNTKKVTAELNSNKWQKYIVVDVATKENFLKKVKLADVVYFHGGASLKLLETLNQYPNLGTLLQGKTVAGESAGANVLCKFFYSPRADSVSKGVGILPFKIIPHYKEEYTGKLDAVGFDLEAILLPEYTYKVFYQ